VLPVTDTPTQPRDYAALSATYGTLLGTVLLAARQRGADPVRSSELPSLGLATFALAKLVGKEKVETWMREPFVDESSRTPKGRGMRYAVGELLTCTRCIGAWAALGIVGLRLVNPPAGRTLSAVLAASAANDFLQATFSWICGEADSTDPSP
jgi:hypothetical protein